jgi:photosystem II stability/assembly factor-like uncharacterized protein
MTFSVAFSTDAVVSPGSDLPPLRVTTYPASGAASAANQEVGVRLGHNAAGATLRGTTVSPAERPTTMFADLHVDRPGTHYTLEVVSPCCATVSTGVFHAPRGWMPLRGMPHGEVTALEVVLSDPATWYVGTREALFKTDNAGGRWSRVDGWTAATPGVTALALDRSAPATVYAGTGEGLFRSLDGGQRWCLVLAGETVRAVHVHPTPYPVVLASAGKRLWRSLDGGDTWVLAASLEEEVVDTLATAWDGTDVLVLAGGANGLHRSRDGGDTWDTTVDLPLRDVRALAVDPQDRRHVLAATGDGLWESVDGSASWVQAGLGGREVTSVAVLYEPAGTLYALAQGLHHRSDATGRLEAVDWQPPVATPRLLTAARLSGTGLLVGTSHGVYVDPPAGTGWERTGGGLDEAEVADLALFSGNVSLVAATPLSLHVSTDTGRAWSLVPGGIGTVSTVSAVRSADMEIFLAGNATGQVTVSLDRGVTWGPPRNLGGNTAQVTRVLVRSSTRFYAGTDTLGLFRSDDGSSWTSTSVPPPELHVRAIALDSSPAAIIVGGPHGVYRTPDGGENWTTLYQETGLGVVDVHVSGTNLYVAGRTSVRYYPGSGLWQHISTTMPAGQVWSMAVAPDDPSTIFLVAYDDETGGRVVRVTRNLGQTWQVANVGLAGCGPVRVRAVSARVAYAATQACGVMTTWTGGL